MTLYNGRGPLSNIKKSSLSDDVRVLYTPLKQLIDDDHRSARLPTPLLIYSRGPTMTSCTVVAAGVRLMTSAKIVIGYCIIQIT